MKIEFMMKVIDRDEEEDEATRIAKRVISGEEEETVKFTYKPYTIDMRDIGTFGLEDDEHTKIMMPFGMFFAKINYYTFCNIYKSGLCTDIKTISDFKMVKR